MTNKPRKPWLAGLLTFLAVGMGHFYTGEPKRGIILFLVGQVLFIATMSCLLLPVLSLNIFVVLAIGLLYTIYCLVDAVGIAKKSESDCQLRAYNKWYYYLAFWVCTAVVFQPLLDLFIKRNIVQAYKIPSASMMPTLFVGDLVLADKFIYGRKDPVRGDIIIFAYPLDIRQDFIKRVVAVGGDTIEIINKRVFLNGKELAEDYVMFQHSNILPGNISPRDNFGPVPVPEGTVFVLGDNRDNAHDSRYWGFVRKEEIKAKTMSIYWSWDKDNFGVRWYRLGIKLSN